jgi:hypothetical protein
MRLLSLTAFSHSSMICVNFSFAFVTLSGPVVRSRYLSRVSSRGHSLPKALPVRFLRISLLSFCAISFRYPLFLPGLSQRERSCIGLSSSPGVLGILPVASQLRCVHSTCSPFSYSSTFFFSFPRHHGFCLFVRASVSTKGRITTSK